MTPPIQEVDLLPGKPATWREVLLGAVLMTVPTLYVMKVLADKSKTRGRE